jgi:hypothetical protein
MFLNTIINYLQQSVNKFIINLVFHEDIILPITIDNNNVKCLDFDIDKVRFMPLQNKKTDFQAIHPDLRIDIDSIV